MESRAAIKHCMDTEGYKIGAPLGIISAYITNSTIRHNSPVLKSMMVLTSGLIGYIFGKCLYLPVCVSKCVPELQSIVENRRKAMERYYVFLAV